MNMSHAIKTDLLPKLRDRYERRDRAGKTRMLDELREDYGYERKYAIKAAAGTVPGLTAGRTNVVEVSTNMTQWLAAGTNVAETTTASFTNSLSGRAGFFRVVELN